MGYYKVSGKAFFGKIMIFAAIIFLFSLPTISSVELCQDITPITEFYSGNPYETVTFPDGGGSDSSAKILVPKELQVSIASVDLTGMPVSSTSENPSDIAIVNDVSGSMDDNCGEDGIADPGETPCKINDMKFSSPAFSGGLIYICSYDGIFSTTNFSSTVTLYP